MTEENTEQTPVEEPPQEGETQDDGSELVDGSVRAAVYREAADKVDELGDEAANWLREQADELDAE